MTNQRRYTEEEVREILEEASKVPESAGRALGPSDGLTLEELQTIGTEVGLSAQRIAEAASFLEARQSMPPRRTSLGMPISVGRVVELPRAPTDREWDLLVSELRETFMAHGRLGGAGGTRHWSNGNLHATVEPTESGYRLRMGTVKGEARQLNVLGGVALFMAALLTVVLVLGGTTAWRELLGPLVFAVGGVGALGANLLRLPAWAREREAQMEHIAARARALLGKEEGAS